MLQLWFLRYVETMIGLPYLYGGDDPMTGFDCSGMVVEALKSVGLVGLHEDLNADGLWQRFKDREVEEPTEGCLAFWLDDADRATHVAVCLDGVMCVTADAGGSSIKTREDAIKANAFIKPRLILHRVRKPRFCNPFKQNA